MSSSTDTSAQQQVISQLNKSDNVIHLTDEINEEVEELKVEQIAEDNVDPTQLAWAPWFTYYAWKSSNKMINVIDVAGESLADFFGITTPKYQTEIDEYYRIQEEKKKIENESAGWVPSNVGVPLVLSEPVKNVENETV